MTQEGVERSEMQPARTGLAGSGLDQAIVTAGVEQPWLKSRDRSSRLWRVLAVSFWLHLTILLLLCAKQRFEGPEEEELPPPSTVAMVFEGGTHEGPALPNPKPFVATPTAPPAPAPTPQAAAPPPPQPPPAPRSQVTVAPPPPMPEAAPPAAPLPIPPPPPPPAVTAEVPAPRPPPRLAMVVPRPPAPVPRPERTPPTMAPARPQAFPTPMNFSFDRPVQRPYPTTRASSRAGPTVMDFSLAPRQGATDNSPFSRVAGAHVGPDWRNELSAWVRAHAYYPEQAAMNDEDGDVTVQVVANPNGHVTSVEMRSRSGSQWLDMALMGLFRDANLPPLHGESESITFNFTMHYILIRTR